MNIRGNTVGTTMPRPDFNQDNSKKADFIKNRPLDRILPEVTSDDNGKVLKVSNGKWALGDDIAGEGGGGITPEDIDEIVERVLEALPYASVYNGEVVITGGEVTPDTPTYYMMFAINGVEYYADKNMTFRDWCDDNSLYEHGDWHIEEGSYGDQITDNTGEWVNGYDTDYAFADDVIVAGNNYSTDGHG